MSIITAENMELELLPDEVERLSREHIPVSYTHLGLIARIDNDSANAIYEMRPNVAKVVSGSTFNESTWEWEDAKDISW